jgi:regulator of extracellular matrix RemA (YlzA/DUF370 family)
LSSVKGRPQPSKPRRGATPEPPDVPRLLNVGYGNVLVAARVIAVVSSQPAPMRRLREEASERGKLIDATQGRRTRSILITDSDHVVLSAVNPETLSARLAADGSPL